MRTGSMPKTARVASRPSGTATYILKAALTNAQREGRWARLRVQMPCLLTGFLLFFVGVALTMIHRSGMPGSLGLCMQATAVVLFLLCVPPANEWLVSLATGTVICCLLIAVAVFTAFVIVPRLRTLDVSSHCSESARPLRSDCLEEVRCGQPVRLLPAAAAAVAWPLLLSSEHLRLASGLAGAQYHLTYVQHWRAYSGCTFRRTRALAAQTSRTAAA